MTSSDVNYKANLSRPTSQELSKKESGMSPVLSASSKALSSRTASRGGTSSGFSAWADFLTTSKPNRDYFVRWLLAEPRDPCLAISVRVDATTDNDRAIT